MSEYYIELQDKNGTYYGLTGLSDEVLYFEDLDDARMMAKGRLDETYVVTRIVNEQGRVVDFFKY
jgi:hypothetical protein